VEFIEVFPFGFLLNNPYKPPVKRTIASFIMLEVLS